MLRDRVARMLHRRFRRKLHAPNIVGWVVRETEDVQTLRLECVRVVKAFMSWFPERPRWQKKSLAEIIDPRDAEKLARKLRRAVLSRQRTCCLVRLRGKENLCVLEITKVAKFHLRFRAWHVAGLVGALIAPPAWMRAVAWIGAVFASFGAMFLVARLIEDDGPRAFSVSILLTILVFGAIRREVARHAAVETVL